MQKIKHLDKDMQHEVAEMQLSRILSQSNIDRQPVIEFLISDYTLGQEEALAVGELSENKMFGSSDSADLQRTNSG